MKRFIKRILFFILPIFFLGIACECLLRAIPNDYRKKHEFLKKHSNHIRTLVLGSSHSYYGINPVYLDSLSFNAGYVSQSYYYDSSFLEKYDWTNLRNLIIPIDYFSLYLDLTNNFQKNSYFIYGKIDKDRSLFDNFEMLGNGFKINMKRMFHYYIMRQPSSTASNSGWGTDYSKEKSMTRIELLKSGKKFAMRHLMKDDYIFLSQKSLLKSIIEYAVSNNINVILYTAPSFRSYVQNLNDVQLQTTHDYAEELAKQYKNVNYYDFLNDTSFKAGDYYNPDHLNNLGAKKFSLKLDSIMKSLN